MLPFEFTIPGPPISYQTSDRSRLHEWKTAVREGAVLQWGGGEAPETGAVQVVVTYYHDGPAVRIDNDNLVKPIQDALSGLVYRDDCQITDVKVRKTDLNGRFLVKGISHVLAEAFGRGKEFLHIRIEAQPDHGEFL